MTKHNREKDGKKMKEAKEEEEDILCWKTRNKYLKKKNREKREKIVKNVA